MSRIIVHKTALVEDGGGDSMSKAAIHADLDESTEVIHSREDEELSMVQQLIGEIEKLDDGEALVIYKVII